MRLSKEKQFEKINFKDVTENGNRYERISIIKFIRTGKVNVRRRENSYYSLKKFDKHVLKSK